MYFPAMFKKIALVIALAALPLLVAAQARATYVDLEAGSLNSGTGGGIFATDGWGGGAFQLAWDIDIGSGADAGRYRYVYTISNPLDTTSPTGQLTKALSHWLLQVSSGDNPFTASNILTGSTTPHTGSPETFEAQTCDASGSNPCLPSDLYGIKYDNPNPDETDPLREGPYTFTLITDRVPTDGNFYAKDGNCNRNSPCDEGVVVAYNTGFTNPEGDFIRVPDTQTTTVPEPMSLLLLGSGLMGLGFLGRKRKR